MFEYVWVTLFADLTFKFLPVVRSHVLAVRLGGRPKTPPKKEKLIMRLREEGESLRGIREQTGLAVETIRKIIERNKEVAA